MARFFVLKSFEDNGEREDCVENNNFFMVEADILVGVAVDLTFMFVLVKDNQY